MIVRESINFNQLSDPFDSLRIGGKLIEIHLITVENPGNGIDEVYTLSETGTAECLTMLQSGKKERNCTYKFTVTPQTDEEWNQERVILTLSQVAGNRIEFNDVIYKMPKSLSESLNFNRSEDPFERMDIGMRPKMLEMIRKCHMESRDAANEFFGQPYYDKEIIVLKSTLWWIYFDKKDPNLAFTQSCINYDLGEDQINMIAEVLKKELGMTVEYLPSKFRKRP